jgi:hypothetical protein
MLAQPRIAARAAGRLEQRIERAIEFGLGAVEVAEREFFPAVFEMWSDVAIRIAMGSGVGSGVGFARTGAGA